MDPDGAVLDGSVVATAGPAIRCVAPAPGSQITAGEGETLEVHVLVVDDDLASVRANATPPPPTSWGCSPWICGRGSG